ncbi:MAG: hypothetical protein K1X71_13260 [Pirellulales bacterium]|nr:hypothetical protein [Pirellulales bacterium]
MHCALLDELHPDLNLWLLRFSVKRRPLLVVLIWAACFVNAMESQGAPVAYYYYGANTAFSAPAGAVGGGYFLIDPTIGAEYEGYILGNHTYRWPLSNRSSLDNRPLPDLNSAIDNSLGDSIAPMFVKGEYAEGYQQGGGGFLRYSPLRVAPFINVYTNNGPPVSTGTPLSSLLASGFRDIAGGDTGSRYTYIEHPTILPFSAEDVFKNPRSFGFGADSRTPKIVGAAIYAEFMPHVHVAGHNVPMRLADVAALFGVDHFNWRQTIVDPPLPLGWKVEVEHFDLSRDPASQPRIDPIVRPEFSADRYVVTNSQGRTEPIDFPEGFAPDDLPFYYNDDDVVRQGNVLGFVDAPGYGADFNVDRLYREFTTELVGVTADGEIRETGVKFMWKSNVVYGPLDGQVVLYDGVFDPSNLPPVVGGEIFDVQVFVPEPASLLLFAVGSCVVLYRASRRGAGRVA